jgi:diaminopropionate ammonia-lyase
MADLPGYRFALAANPSARPGADYGPKQAAVLDAEGLETARQTITAWPGYAPTPLVELSGIARAAAIGRLDYKNEAPRFGLGSFKPLGGAFAVARLLAGETKRRTGETRVNIADVLAGRYRDVVAGVTVTAGTDGNHGRSVAWGARMFGCRCVIFIHETVTEGRETAIARFGAEVRRTPGGFDDAVRMAQATAEAEGWHVVPDTSDGSVVEAPRNVMQGYTLMAAETIAQLPYAGPPTHIFLQAGVGGMAAATCAQFWQSYGADRPKTVLVEPETAACWFQSLKAGRPVAIEGDLESIMAGLACGEVSRLAWTILLPGADAMMTVNDEAAVDCMRLLAEGRHGDAPLVAGESAVAGLAGLLAAAGDDEARARLDLDRNSRVVLFGTEGATDPETYARIVGRPPEEVERR